MSKKKPFISLAWKMTFAVVIGLVLALGVYVCCTWVEQTVTNQKYLSDEALEKSLNEAYDSFEAYITENQVEATDTKALSKWVNGQEYVYLLVYDNHTNIFEAGWWIVPSEEAPDEKLTDESSILYGNVYEGAEKRIDEVTFTEDLWNRIVTFADGEYYVYLDVYKEFQWRQLMGVVTLVLCFLTLLATILVYNGMLLRRIASLSANIQKVSDGELEHQVYPRQNDELGALAVSVDNMRTSIIKKHQNERDAWQANQQLITEMSHDIRTPLTSLIGYLDIIEGKKYDSLEDLKKYISASRDKAFQLKDLSDKLFQYFLVYGSQAAWELEKVDASILFQQILMEHSAELMGRGYDVELDVSLPEVDVLVEISGTRRLFDNLFSNILKYADRAQPVCIEAKEEENQIIIRMENKILEGAAKVESNKIGLKTCEKICSTFGGRFVYRRTENHFIVWVHLPYAKGENATEKIHS